MTYIKLTWGNSCNLGKIYYESGFVNKLYIDAPIGKPDYEYEVEEEYNSDGVLVSTYKRLVKIYKFEMFAPEYVADALQAMQLHDNINITLTDGTYSSAIRNVKVDVSWEGISNECLALCTVSFQQNDQITRTNCCPS